MRERRRREMLLLEHIENTMETTPDSVGGSVGWAQDLINSLKEARKYQISAHEAIDL